MKVAQLFSIYAEYFVGDAAHVDVKNLTQNSQEVEPGSVFVAIKGQSSDGHQFLKQAVDQGASALVVQDAKKIPENFSGTYAVVPDSRKALHVLSNHYFGHPADELFCIGITGTNGKTSTSYMTECILNHFGWPTGVLGTVNHHLGEKIWQSQLTTPDSITLYKRLREMRALNAKAVAFEVSSHALEQSRVDQFPFDVAVFTNLTRDHLDYHKTMENYFLAKQKLFSEVLMTSKKKHRTAVINADDPYGKNLAVADGVRRIFYGRSDGDLRFQVREMGFSKTKVDWIHQQKTHSVELPMVGLFYIYNAAAALSVGLAAGVSLASGLEALTHFSGVPGRLQAVANSKGLHVLVDYAHTDDALRSVLTSLDEIRKSAGLGQKIITVFGCGGDRDQGKRPLMLKAALEHSDLIFVTSDNPRTEDPERIIDEILKGSPSELINQKIFRDSDRKQSIGKALQMASPGDVVLIAGKGHESYQIIGQEVLPFSDAAVATEFMGN